MQRKLMGPEASVALSLGGQIWMSGKMNTKGNNRFCLKTGQDRSGSECQTPFVLKEDVLINSPSSDIDGILMVVMEYRDS